MEQVTCKNCGSVNDYRTELSGQHLKAICNVCDRYIKFLPQNNPVLVMPFGKFKDREISSLTSKEEVEYLTWGVSNLKLSTSIKLSIKAHLDKLSA